MIVLGLWLGYAAIVAPLFAVSFVWALRAGQFRDQERARGLAFHDEPVPDARETVTARPAWWCWAPALLAGLVLAAMLGAVAIGLLGGYGGRG
jgi:nitrogen fixation-related uncharacterized protein